jgi:hypothetical protein
MKIIFVLLFAGAVLHGYAQPVHTIPTEEMTLTKYAFFADSDYFGITDEHGKQITFTLLKKDIGKVSEFSHPCRVKKYDGYSIDEKNVYFYFHLGIAENGDIPKWKVASLSKTSKDAEVNDLVLPEWTNDDIELASFTRHNVSYRIFRNSKTRILNIYQVTGVTAKKLGSYELSKEAFRAIKKCDFIFTEAPKPIQLGELRKSKISWQGESLTLAYRDLDAFHATIKHYLVSLNLKDGTVKERKLSNDLFKYDRNDFILEDKAFLLTCWNDSLILDIRNLADWRTLKKFSFGKDSELSIKSTPYVTSRGDTVERRWNEERSTARLLKDIRNGIPFVHVNKETDGYYTLTIGSQQYPGGGPKGPFPGSPEMPSTFVGGYREPQFLDQEYFKGCLTDQFKPMPCQPVATLPDKVLKRKMELKKIESRYVIQTFGGTPDMSKEIYDKEKAYLIYIDKEKKAITIEDIK